MRCFYEQGETAKRSQASRKYRDALTQTSVSAGGSLTVGTMTGSGYLSASGGSYERRILRSSRAVTKPGGWLT
ncbi:hypothetical protein [Musicola paradisiaca]|uniref:Uncharacterized protein n=1 Tax=Musicola paradisiaca (strain Ech703) TaxID=579405 RepID=C6C5Y8_MUSP7|nr:hypothetical protein [Musicola paradisiaca]ACS85779.1 hypothetical protein Dd703_1989 [Musicola paradisiaca Ech703]